MKLTEMIAKCKREAERLRDCANNYDAWNDEESFYYEENIEKSEEYEQIAGWLEELKEYRDNDDRRKCSNCIEWQYFEGYGYGCFCMKTMIPLDDCENFVYKKR